MSPPRAPYVGDPGTFEVIVHDLVLDGAAQVLTIDDDHLVVNGANGVIVVARLRVAGEAALAALVDRLKAAGAVVVVAGGTPGEGAAALAEVGWAGAPWVQALHVADDGSVGPASGDGRAGAVFGWLTGRAPQDVDWPRFWATLGTQRALADHSARLIQERLQARTPWVSRSLIGVMALIFVVESVLGAPRQPEILQAMGALHGPWVAEGQVWRVLSATLLHGSAIHAGLNLYVLYRLGDLVERVVGPARFLLIYVLAGIGGSMASMAMPDHWSVGASGAIWGVMGAELILGLLGRGKLPEPLRRAMKVAAGQNLLLNLLVSFSPGIDWAAHFGGGVAGAIVMFALVRGLPDWPEPGAAPVREPATPSLVWIGAFLGGVLLVGAAIMVAVGAWVALPLAGLA